MASADAAAWAQAYLSAAAIVVSTSIAVFVPWNERRLARKREEASRLEIQCRRSDAGGLEVELTYFPEFQNYAVGASLALIEPSDARVYKGRIERVSGANGFSGFQNVVGALGQSVRYNAVSLLRTGEPDVSRDAHRGVMFIEYPDERVGPDRVKARIDVLIHGNHRILSRTLMLSAIDDEYYGRGAPVAVIRGTKPGI